MIFFFCVIIKQMPNEQEPPVGGLEKLEKKLYERSSDDFSVRRSGLSPVYKEINRAWLDDALPRPTGKKKMNPWFKFFWVAFIFFVITLGLSAYFLWRGTGVVSDKNIEVAVQGPVSVKAGDVLNLNISLTNNNTAAINQVELTVAYPTGTKDATEPTKDLVYDTQEIGEIAAGGMANVASKAIIFGQENSELQIDFNLRYHLVGSNTLFEKKVSYRLKVTASPIDVSLQVPETINSNQPFKLVLTVTSNAEKMLNNVIAQLTYPSGFRYQKADLAPASGNNQWQLGDLASGAKKIINITGVVEGEPEQLKAFEVKVGTAEETATDTIAILYNDFFQTATVAKPFLGLSLANSSGQTDNLSQNAAVVVPYNLTWSNNLSEKINDLNIKIILSGNALDQSGVSVSDGYYSSTNNTVTWNKSTNSDFATLSAGASGKLTFNLRTLPLASTGNAIRNPYLTLKMTISGTRISSGFANEVVDTDLAQTIKINSDVNVLAESLYTDGPFTNSGPKPPVVDTPTTYTVRWTVTNSSNDLTNALIKTKLPLWVSWAGLTSPSTEDVSYDASTREVIWHLGTIKAATGVELDKRQASFQVTLTPSASQRGTTVNLTTEANFSALDTWTGNQLTASTEAVTTWLKTDSTYSYGDNAVQ